MRIVHCHQGKDTMDCARCVAAMILGTTLASVRLTLPGDKPTKLTLFREALGACALAKYFTSCRGVKPVEPCVVRSRKRGAPASRVTHFVLFAQGKVYDPDWPKPVSWGEWRKETKREGSEVAAFLPVQLAARGRRKRGG
jgi:hypothetical protein